MHDIYYNNILIYIYYNIFTKQNLSMTMAEHLLAEQLSFLIKNKWPVLFSGSFTARQPWLFQFNIVSLVSQSLFPCEKSTASLTAVVLGTKGSQEEQSGEKDQKFVTPALWPHYCRGDRKKQNKTKKNIACIYSEVSNKVTINRDALVIKDNALCLYCSCSFCQGYPHFHSVCHKIDFF